MSLNLKDGRAFIVAEAGTAHADPEPARRFRKALDLVSAAANAGADAVKFQWFAGSMPEEDQHNPDIFSDMFCWLPGDEQRQMRWQASIMGPGHWVQIKEYADACGLIFLASAFQTRTARLLINLDLAATKVASRAAKTFPYDMEGLPRPFLISGGMGLPPEEVWPKTAEIGWMQCEAKYPSTEGWDEQGHWAPWPGRHGFSDHSGAPFLGIDAISRGCKLLEVHFMVDPIDAGPDLPACLTVDELKLICEARDYYANR